MQKLFTRNFIFLTIGQAVSMFGTAILKFTISLYILDLTGSAAIFGTVTAISSIPPIFLSALVLLYDYCAYRIITIFTPLIPLLRTSCAPFVITV